MAKHPGIVFKDGPTGRRAALSAGPDVWEVVRALRETDGGDDAIEAVSELMDLPTGTVYLATRYYGDHRDEIDSEIDLNEADAEAAFEAWQAQPRLQA